MIGLGTLINGGSIIAGGIIGIFAGKLFKSDQQEALNKACGVSVLFIAIAGAMEGMLKISDGGISSGKSMLVVLCLAIGTVIGELIGIEKGFEKFGGWLKRKTGNGGDKSFVNAFGDRFTYRFHRSHGHCRSHTGWSFGRLFHPCGQVGSGLYYNRRYDLVNG